MMRWDQVAAWVGEPKRGAEIGVRSGVSTAYLLYRFPKLHMIAVDAWRPLPPSDEPGHETYERWDFAKIRAEFDERIQQHANRVTVLAMDSLEAAATVPDGSLDFVFIDANHGYSGVLADLKAWMPKVRRGGTLCGHDYWDRFPGVRRALEELKLPVEAGAEHTWRVRC